MCGAASVRVSSGRVIRRRYRRPATSVLQIRDGELVGQPGRSRLFRTVIEQPPAGTAAGPRCGSRDTGRQPGHGTAAGPRRGSRAHRPERGTTRPDSYAATTACARSRRPSLANTRHTWLLTVWSLTMRRSAISAFDSPAAMTSVSRGVSAVAETKLR